MMYYENVKILFQVFNSERYHHVMVMVSIEIQINEELSQMITKWYHQLELQDLGEEKILTCYVMTVIGREKDWTMMKDQGVGKVDTLLCARERSVYVTWRGLKHVEKYQSYNQKVVTKSLERIVLASIK